MKTTTINSMSDIRAWLWNTNPGNAAQSDSHVDAIQLAIQNGNHPAFGEGWGPWLDENAERIALHLPWPTDARLDQIEELVGILQQPDLTEEERGDYLECVENVFGRLDESLRARSASASR